MTFVGDEHAHIHSPRGGPGTPRSAARPAGVQRCDAPVDCIIMEGEPCILAIYVSDACVSYMWCMFVFAYVNMSGQGNPTHRVALLVVEGESREVLLTDVRHVRP